MLPRPDRVPPPSRVTVKSMQLLFLRLSSEHLVRTLEEQGVWALLGSSSTFLQGAGLLARWAPRLPRWLGEGLADGGAPLGWWEQAERPRESFLPALRAPEQQM